jgi:hypothetical protein
MESTVLCVLCCSSLDMIKSSHLSTKTGISLVLGSDYTVPARDKDNELQHGGMVHDMYVADSDDSLSQSEQDGDDDDDDDDEKGKHEEEVFVDKPSAAATFSPFCEKVTRKKDLPTPLFAGRI